MPSETLGDEKRLQQWIHNAGITASVEVINAEKARQWLETNTENYRKESQPHINNLCRDMLNGNFTFTNASIAFDVNGKLVDGQHRLLAVVKSGSPIVALVVRDMPEGSAANPSIDSGKNRICTVHLQNHGVQYASAVASVIRCLASLHAGVKQRTHLTNVELASIASENPELIECVIQCRPAKHLAAIKIVGSWFWIASKENEVLALHCLDVLKGVVSESTLHPFNRLREVCLKDKASVRKMPVSVLLTYFFAAWVKTLKGEQVKVLRPLSELKVGSRTHQRLYEMFESVITALRERS